MAVPMTVKIPDPITAPMPRAVSDQGPSDFFSACSGSSESLISLSIDLHEISCLRSVRLLRSESEPGRAARAIEADLSNACRAGDRKGRIAPPDRIPGLNVGRAWGTRSGSWTGSGPNASIRPRTIFFTFFLAAPRGVVRLALGAAFLRAVRFSFFRSWRSSILVVSTCNLFRCYLFNVSGFPGCREFNGNSDWPNSEQDDARPRVSFSRTLSGQAAIRLEPARSPAVTDQSTRGTRRG